MMTSRGRLVAEVFDCRDEEFPGEYLGASGHLDPGVAARLHDTCAVLYEGRLSVRGSLYDAWEDWESVLKGFTEACGLGCSGRGRLLGLWLRGHRHGQHRAVALDGSRCAGHLGCSNHLPDNTGEHRRPDGWREPHEPSLTFLDSPG